MKCDNCTEKCPQEELACEIAKGRMYATNEVVRLQKELKEIKAKAIDEFAEQLKSDEFQKYTLDMVFETSRNLSYSQCINAFEEYIDEIAEQMKGE